MRFSEHYLKEYITATLYSEVIGKRITIPLVKSPSKTEFMQIAKHPTSKFHTTKLVRIGIGDDNEVWIWPGLVFHAEVTVQEKIPFKFRFVYDLTQSDYFFTDWPEEYEAEKDREEFLSIVQTELKYLPVNAMMSNVGSGEMLFDWVNFDNPEEINTEEPEYATTIKQFHGDY